MTPYPDSKNPRDVVCLPCTFFWALMGHSDMLRHVIWVLLVMQAPLLLAGDGTPVETTMAVLHHRNSSTTTPRLTSTRRRTTTTRLPYYKCKGNITSETLYLKNIPNSQKQRHPEYIEPGVFWRGESANPLPAEIKMNFDKKYLISSYPFQETGNTLPPIQIGNEQRTVCPALPSILFKKEDYFPHFKPIDRESSIFVGFAYFDTRMLPHPQIRIYGIAPYRSPSYYCQVACLEYQGVAISERSESRFLSVMPDVDDFGVWQQHVYVCPLSFKCTPSHVTLTTAECSTPVNVFPIKTVGNNHTAPPIKFATCTSMIFDLGDADIPRLVEFVEINRQFGVQKMYFYDTFNVSVRFEAAFRAYEEKGIIERIPWRIPREVRVIYYFAQVLQYQDCNYRHMDEAEYLGLFDIDDILVPSGHGSLELLFRTLPANRAFEPVAAFQFVWVPLCTTTSPEPAPDGNEANRKVHVTLGLTTHVIPGKIPEERKQIIVPRGVVFPHVHGIFGVVSGWDPIYFEQDLNVAVVYHYKSNNALCLEKFPDNPVFICPFVGSLQSRILDKLVDLNVIESPHSPRVLYLLRTTWRYSTTPKMTTRSKRGNDVLVVMQNNARAAGVNLIFSSTTLTPSAGPSWQLVLLCLFVMSICLVFIRRSRKYLRPR